MFADLRSECAAELVSLDTGSVDFDAEEARVEGKGQKTRVVPIGPGNPGAPPVTPRELLAWARSKLVLPLPAVRTAPPHGSDGLVGLPEWFWVAPGQWHPEM